MIMMSLNIVIILLVLWSILRSYRMMNKLHNEVMEKSSILREKIDFQERKVEGFGTKLQGSYAMGEAMCRRVDILSKDIDKSTKVITESFKVISALSSVIVPNNKQTAFIEALDEYDNLVKEKTSPSPPPPTADEKSSPTQGSTKTNPDSKNN